MANILCRVSGGGAASGTAKRENVLNGKTFAADDGSDLVGSMPDNTGINTNGNCPGISKNLPTVPSRKGSNLQQTVNTVNENIISIAPPKGYYSGGEYVSAPSSQFGNAIKEHVLKTDTFTSLNGLNTAGTMENHGSNTQMNSVGRNGDNLYIRIPQGAYLQNAGSGYPEIQGAASEFIKQLNVASISSFNAAQVGSQQIRLTWAKPSRGGLYSGVRICGKQGGWPSNPDDGSIRLDTGDTYYDTGRVGTGMWYFRAWSYFTYYNNQRKYIDNPAQASINNVTILGSKDFTYSQSWQVPSLVRSIQVFLVGGGGGTPNLYSSGDNSEWGGGGGGGYTSTGYLNVTPGESLSINVGAGGGVGGTGGTSSIYRGGTQLISAGGGNPGGGPGGNGGSGGGAGAYRNAGNGGRNGGNGEAPSSKYSPTGIGYGQGRTTHCPWDDIAYAGGGGGGSEWSSEVGSAWDGGGSGGSVNDASNGQANTGGGAGGSGHGDSIGASHGRSGGSGIVRIRWY